MTLERIEINLKTQVLTAYYHDRDVRYACSTARNGPGESLGSECTPRGLHRIRAIIGLDVNPMTVFVGRRPTGELWAPDLHKQTQSRDWILGRILWLCGEEPGKNRGGNVDTQRRFIYIHGTPPTEPMGIPFSHGCIRMMVEDVSALASDVTASCPVLILEY